MYSINQYFYFKDWNVRLRVLKIDRVQLIFKKILYRYLNDFKDNVLWFDKRLKKTNLTDWITTSCISVSMSLLSVKNVVQCK